MPRELKHGQQQSVPRDLGSPHSAHLSHARRRGKSDFLMVSAPNSCRRLASPVVWCRGRCCLGGYSKQRPWTALVQVVPGRSWRIVRARVTSRSRTPPTRLTSFDEGREGRSVHKPWRSDRSGNARWQNPEPLYRNLSTAPRHQRRAEAVHRCAGYKFARSLLSKSSAELRQEHKAAMQRAQALDCSIRQRDDVLPLHLHAPCRYRPSLTSKIKLTGHSLQGLILPSGRQNNELQRA